MNLWQSISPWACQCIIALPHLSVEQHFRYSQNHFWGHREGCLRTHEACIAWHDILECDFRCLCSNLRLPGLVSSSSSRTAVSSHKTPWLNKDRKHAPGQRSLQATSLPRQSIKQGLGSFASLATLKFLNGPPQLKEQMWISAALATGKPQKYGTTYLSDTGEISLASARAMRLRQADLAASQLCSDMQHCCLNVNYVCSSLKTSWIFWRPKSQWTAIPGLFYIKIPLAVLSIISKNS